MSEEKSKSVRIATMVQNASPYCEKPTNARFSIRVLAKQAKLSIGGLVWTSPTPETEEEAAFFNGAADRINETIINQ